MPSRGDGLERARELVRVCDVEAREELVSMLSTQAFDQVAGTLALLARGPESASLVVEAGAAATADGRAVLIAAVNDVGLSDGEIRTLLQIEPGLTGARYAFVDALLTSALEVRRKRDEVELPHACAGMETNVRDVRVPLDYHPEIRAYGVPLAGAGADQLLFFCPFCGVALPATLQDQRADRLDELGHEWGEPVPEPYDSDRWWRADSGLSHE